MGRKHNTPFDHISTTSCSLKNLKSEIAKTLDSDEKQHRSENKISSKQVKVRTKSKIQGNTKKNRDTSIKKHIHQAARKTVRMRLKLKTLGHLTRNTKQ